MNGTAPAWRVTITSSDGTSEASDYTSGEARQLLATAAQRGYAAEATWPGGITITRPVHGFSLVRRLHIVRLEPLTPAGKITPAVRRDLELINGRRSRTERGTGVILAGNFGAIPAGAARRLRARGLIEDDGQAVTVSLSARLAMCAQAHRATASAPGGYYRPAERGVNSAGLNKPGGRNGLLYDPGSTARCPCKWYEPCGSQVEARRKAAEHRQAETGRLLAELAGDGEQ